MQFMEIGRGLVERGPHGDAVSVLSRWHRGWQFVDLTGIAHFGVPLDLYPIDAIERRQFSRRTGRESVEGRTKRVRVDRRYLAPQRMNL